MSTLTLTEQHLLKDIASSAIEFALQHDRPPKPDISRTPLRLREKGNCQIKIYRGNQLVGEATSVNDNLTLAESTNLCAFNALNDSDYAEITPAQWPHCHLVIDVLTEPEPVFVKTERDLLTRLTPGEDGIIFDTGKYTVNLPPTAWQQFPEKQGFISQLKKLANCPSNAWPAYIRIQRYQSQRF